jgi:hypothetical protein
MKLATFTALAMLLSAGYAFAGAGAPGPEGLQAAPPSGRPSAVLDDSKCQDVWTKAGGTDSLSYDKAGPYVTNLKLADPDGDGRFTKDEFMAACKIGVVQQQPSKPAGATGGGQTPENPTEPAKPY